jgi:CBS domain-containing protein
MILPKLERRPTVTIKRPLVVDVMTTRPIVLTVDSSLEEADLVLRSTFIRGVPVVDRDGVLVGVVSHADLVAYRFAHLGTSDETTRTGPTSAN